MAANPPTGTVTFLFTDIEGSTRLAEEHSDIWETVQDRHHAMLRSAAAAHNGHVFHIIGDAFCIAFYSVTDALKTALWAQRKLQTEALHEVPVKVRMGIHTGEAQAIGGEYRGYLTLARVQRVMSTAYGGQILLSTTSADLLRDALPEGVILRDMGEHRLKGLLHVERLWQAAAPDLAQDFPALQDLNATPNNLPTQLTSFVGREGETESIRTMLATHRLVTLTGPGGAGKTRLALQVAEEVLDSFKDGVWYIELAPLSSGELVVDTVAATLSLPEEQHRPLIATLLDRLRGMEVLLLLDNCEHLIEACASFADTVLHASGRLRILATSRQALGISAETAYQVPSLETPDLARSIRMTLDELKEYAAVRLFADRAGQVLSTFTLTDANVHAVAEVCYRLDGLPLAIELAAARVRALRVEEIAQRLNDRFRLLTGGSRTAVPRHHTLRAVIDWSFGLLSESERVALRRLSVFAGSWSMAAAEELCAGNGIEPGAVLDLLTQLVDKSLVSVDESRAQSRYGMLETIRQYAQQKLLEADEGERIRDRHLSLMLELVNQAEAQMHGPDELIWFDRLELEIDNLRLALEWALGLDDPKSVLSLSGSLYWFWWTRSYWHEAHRWLGEALSRPGAEKPTLARAKALTAMGYFSMMSGDLEAARDQLEESVRIHRAVGERLSLADALTTMALVSSVGNDPAVAAPAVEEGLMLSRELGYKLGTARSLLGLGEIQLSHGRDEQAMLSYEQSAALFREVGERNLLGFLTRRLGYMAIRRADYLAATAFCAESLSLNQGLGDLRGVAASLAALASIATSQGRAVRAARLHGAIEAALDSFGGQLIPADQSENERCVSAARAAIGEEQYAVAFAEGRSMRLEEAIAYALDRARE